MTQQLAIPLLPGEKADVREDARDLIQDADAWFEMPNTIFGGKSARELVEEGREEIVRNALRAIRFGMFT